MPDALFVRPLSAEEEDRLRARVRGGDIFALRRAQILLGSAQGQSVKALSRQVGLTPQMVRHVIHLFHAQGVWCLRRGSHRPKSCAPLLDEVACQRLGELMHQCPRTFGKERSVWSLELLAEVAFEQGMTPHQVSKDTIRRALIRLGVKWKRAKAWITSPDAHYERKKSGASV